MYLYYEPFASWFYFSSLLTCLLLQSVVLLTRLPYITFFNFIVSKGPTIFIILCY